MILPKIKPIKQTNKIIAVCDTETDPFKKGRVPKPFALGFLTPDRYLDFWGDDCIKQFFEFLSCEKDQYIIYAHNGGKFDFHFMLEHITAHKKPLIMNSRIAKIYLQNQEFRDSYSIIPDRLSAYIKDEIDYRKFEREKREKYREEILQYQKNDCIYLYDLVSEFHAMFGDKITIASAAMDQLNSMHGFERIEDEPTDAEFRPYYFGGRNQCFEKGILHGQWKLYDRNSMYPSVMKDCLHPIGKDFGVTNVITKNTDFALIEATNENCLPFRTENGSLDFTRKSGTFYASIHEINAGLETNTIKINRVIETIQFTHKASFADFVDRFYKLRQNAKASGDKIRNILYKLILNSAYGKFALDCRKFKKYEFTLNEIPDGEGWNLESQLGEIMIWSKPDPKKYGFLNIATAASITAASRANLHVNLCKSTRPIYCDTDSIICEAFDGYINPNELGAWDLEAEGDCVAIAGKKMYALTKGGADVKKASKGVILSSDEIKQICLGKIVLHENEVPRFRLGADPQFTNRNIKMT